MNFKISVIFGLCLLLILTVLGLYYFYKNNFKHKLVKSVGLALLLIISVVSVFGIIISATGEGLTPEMTLLLNDYSADFYRTYKIEEIKTNNYHFYLDSWDGTGHPNMAIALKKEGFLYHLIKNEVVTYQNDENDSLLVRTYDLGDKYLHFISFYPTYFEEIGHIGNYLPQTVVINGEEVEVKLYYYCYSSQKIDTLEVNGKIFHLQEFVLN